MGSVEDLAVEEEKSSTLLNYVLGQVQTVQFHLTQRVRQMRGNFGEYKIFIIPSYEFFFSKQNI